MNDTEIANAARAIVDTLRQLTTAHPGLEHCPCASEIAKLTTVLEADRQARWAAIGKTAPKLPKVKS